MVLHFVILTIHIATLVLVAVVTIAREEGAGAVGRGGRRGWWWRGGLVEEGHLRMLGKSSRVWKGGQPTVFCLGLWVWRVFECRG